MNKTPLKVKARAHKLIFCQPTKKVDLLAIVQ